MQRFVLENILRTTSEPAAIISQEYRFIFVNTGYCKVLNREKRELIGNKVEAVTSRKYFDKIIKPLLEKCTMKQKAFHKVILDDAEGLKHSYEISYFPYYERDELSNGFITIAHELALFDRYGAKETIFKKMLDYSLNAIMLIDGEGYISYANEKALELLNLKQTSATSKSISELDFLFPEGIRQKILNLNGEFETQTYDVAFKNASDKVISFEVKISDFFWEKIRYFYFNARDISYRKEIEQKLLNSRISETIALDAKNRFLANINHELRNPLNGILGMLKLIDVNELSEASRMYFSNAVNIAEKLAVMMEDLIFLSEIEKEINPVFFNADDCVEYIERLFRKKAENKSLSLVINKNYGRLIFYNDKIKILQIIVHLLSNAIKFSESGTVSVNLSYNGELIIGIKDEGISIPEEYLDKIFIPFFQIEDPYNKKHSGTGVGLSIVKDIITLLGGRISVTSKEGCGTEVTVAIPSAYNE